MVAGELNDEGAWPYSGSFLASLDAATARRPRGSSALEISSDAHPGVFDELVVDRWFHLEEMDRGRYWMRIGNVHVNVTLRLDGGIDMSILANQDDIPSTCEVHGALDTDGQRSKGRSRWWDGSGSGARSAAGAARPRRRGVPDRVVALRVRAPPEGDE